MKNKEHSLSTTEKLVAPIEVETRALISRDVLTTVIENLEQLGAERILDQRIEDAHFCPQNVRSFDEIAMNKVGSYGLRVRRITKSSGVESNINTKVLTRQNDHSSWREIESSIQSWESICQILEIIGFKCFFSILKDRQTYELGEYTIVFDEIPDFGTVIEVEQLVDDINVDKAKNDTRHLLSQIGVLDRDILTTSVSRILMQKFAKF